MNVDKKDFGKKWNKALNIIGTDIIESMKDKLTQKNGKDTGYLQASIKYEVDGDTIIFSMAEHGKYVDFGTPPHMPPVEALEGWAVRKLGDKKLAWALAIHIKKYGTRPFPFIRNTFDLHAPKIVGDGFKEAFQ